MLRSRRFTRSTWTPAISSMTEVAIPNGSRSPPPVVARPPPFGPPPLALAFCDAEEPVACALAEAPSALVEELDAALVAVPFRLPFASVFVVALAAFTLAEAFVVVVAAASAPFRLPFASVFVVALAAFTFAEASVVAVASAARAAAEASVFVLAVGFAEADEVAVPLGSAAASAEASDEDVASAATEAAA